MSDITQLEPRLLLAFVAISEECSVSRAAERLHITQQGMSGMLVRLRQQFDDPLFVRTPHGVSPTPYAETLYPKVVAAIEGLKSLIQTEVFDPRKIETTFCIAANDYAISVIIPPLFGHLRNLSPNLKLCVVSLQVNLLADQMRTGQIDLALTVPEFLPDNLHSKILFTDHYKCAFRKGHPLATKKMTVDEFCKVEHLLVAPNGKDMRSATDAILAQTGRSRTIAIAVPNFLVAETLLATTDLLGILPARLLDEISGNLFVIEPPIEIPAFEIIYAWSTRVHAEPINVWIREILRMLVGDR